MISQSFSLTVEPDSDDENHPPYFGMPPRLAELFRQVDIEDAGIVLVDFYPRTAAILDSFDFLNEIDKSEISSELQTLFTIPRIKKLYKHINRENYNFDNFSSYKTELNKIIDKQELLEKRIKVFTNSLNEADKKTRKWYWKNKIIDLCHQFHHFGEMLLKFEGSGDKSDVHNDIKFTSWNEELYQDYRKKMFDHFQEIHSSLETNIKSVIKMPCVAPYLRTQLGNSTIKEVVNSIEEVKAALDATFGHPAAANPQNPENKYERRIKRGRAHVDELLEFFATETFLRMEKSLSFLESWKRDDAETWSNHFEIVEANVLRNRSQVETEKVEKVVGFTEMRAFVALQWKYHYQIQCDLADLLSDKVAQMRNFQRAYYALEASWHHQLVIHGRIRNPYEIPDFPSYIPSVVNKMKLIKIAQRQDRVLAAAVCRVFEDIVMKRLEELTLVLERRYSLFHVRKSDQELGKLAGVRNTLNKMYPDVYVGASREWFRRSGHFPDVHISYYFAHLDKE